MGSKTAKSTQAISIPPEVLARYNAINARADTVTNKPYQYYGGQFVAPLTGTQQAGIANTNAAANMAQPYYGAATNQLMGAQQAASPYYQGATQQLAQGINTGSQLAAQSYGTLGQAQGVGNELAGQSYGALGQAQGVGNELAAQSYGALGQAQGVGNQFANQSSGTLSQAQGVGNQFANQSSGTLGQAQGIGNELAGQSYNALGQAQGIGNELAGQSYGALGQAQDVGTQLAGQSLGTINAAQSQANQIQQGALGGLGAAYSGAQPYNQAAGGQYAEGLGLGQGLSGAASYGTQQALTGAQPFQQAATQYMGSGAQAVNPNELGAEQINKYLSPYLNTVLQGTAGLLNQQNQQQQAGQMGNAIRSGAFGGDRGGIAAANLNQQQNLANSKIYSDILNQGFGQALGTAQQQQQLGLGAAQANRAAQQQASQQALAIGQQGFGQGLSAAQQQGALGQQLFGMGSTTGQNLANLGQQVYGQGTGSAQAQAALAQQMFGQGATTAQQQAALGQQQFGQGATAAGQLASLGQQQFGQGATAAGQLASLGQQQFGQGLSTAQQQAALGQQQFGQGATAASQQAALGQQQFGQGATTAGQLASLGQQQFGQGATTAGQLASLGQQQFGQGATAAGQQAALGQQQFGQGTAASQQAAALGQGIYGMGANTSQQLAGLGAGAQGAALTGAGAQLAAGQAEQATQQAENTAKYNEFLQAQSLPYQQLKLAGDIALGTGTASGSTTTTQQPGGFFSDERLKENIKAVGKTFDGQTIHSYNYKGDPRTQIGLIAQEVQKHHPEAVGLAGGYKTVDYEKATEDASDRGHMAYGGLASAGGSVLPQNAGQGFADGGLAGFDPSSMQQMLAAQQAMYAPLSGGGMYAGGPNAGGGLVPQSEFTARQLMMPAELSRQATGAEQAATIANLGKTVGELGDDVGAWNWGGDKAEKADKTPVPTTAAPTRASEPTPTPPPPVDTTPPTPENFFKKKGDEYYALGGGVPYSGQGLDIPDSGMMANSNKPLAASALQTPQSGLDKAGKVAGIADTGMKAAKFGKKIGLFAVGGGIPYGGKGLDIPESEMSSSARPLATAGDAPDKPESGISKVKKVADIAKTVASVAAMFSDKRMKENIKPIGKMFDGQIVHSYNYKGDPRTQIGLIAQEVEGHKPRAVGKAGGMKTVDYAKATSASARRGHFAMGGSSEEEMDDIPSYDPTGLYHGDNKFVRNLFKSTVSGNKNIDLMSGEEIPQQAAEEAPQERAILKPVETSGLAAAKAGLPELLGAKGQKAPSTPTGLAPAALASVLPKNIVQIARLIHAGEGTGQNPMSSAKGPYQMIDSTFAGEFRKNYPDRAKGMSEGEIVALKRSPEGAAISEAMGPKLIANNARIVERGGFEPDAGNVYLAHFLGPDTAVKVLRADPNAPIGRFVSAEAIEANPQLRKYPTAGGVINWARGYMEKQDRNLRKNLASGGLAGRRGYQTAGAVDDKDPVNLLPPVDLLAEEVRDKDLPVDAAPPTPERGNVTGVAPPMAATVLPDQAPKMAMPTGVAGGVPAQAAKPAEGEDNNFFRGIAKGKATSIIPLLSGIAAMGAAPTRSLGVALATGLGAGAQAAQGQRAFGIKQGELGVAKQLADARTMEITKGILEGRYQFLENGQVWDKYTDTFLPAEKATIARAKAFAKGPEEALTGVSSDAVPRADYLIKNPTAGTDEPKLPISHSYDAVPNNPSTVIFAAAELTPGVMEARKDRDASEYKMKELYKTLSSPGVGIDRYNQLASLYDRSVGDWNRADAKWKETIANVVKTPIVALERTNDARIGINADALVPLIADARTAMQTKQTISELSKNIGTGGPLSPITQKIGNGLIQLGVDENLVNNLVRAPTSSQTQEALAAQLRSYGSDPVAAEALKLSAGPAFNAAAVKAILAHANREADSKIAAFTAGNNAFYKDPIMGDVAGASVGAQGESLNTKMYKFHPPPGSVAKGTPYRVGNDRKVYYAK